MELLTDPVMWCVVLSLLGILATEAAKAWGGRLLWFIGITAFAVMLVTMVLTWEGK